MSLPDLDYELSSMGQFEYSVELAKASSSEDMEFVAKAFAAGQEKERKRIDSELSALADSSGHVSLALFKLRKIINND